MWIWIYFGLVAPWTQQAAIDMLTLCAPDYLSRPGVMERILHITYRTMQPVRLRFEDERGRVFVGYTVAPDTVELRPGYEDDVDTIAHEMLHVAIGKPGHGYTAFSACGLGD